MIEFWLTFNNGSEKLRLPVPPTDFSITTGLQNTTVNIHELGEILLIGKRKLKTISLSSYFPIRDDGLCQYSGFPSPAECVDMISRWRDSGRPIRLLIVGESLRVNEAMVIESFTPSQRHGPQDIYYTLDLKEYRFVDQNRDTNGLVSAVALLSEYTGNTRAVEWETPHLYTYQEGDSLWAVAKRVYGDGSRADEIRTKNGILDERLIQVGRVLMV